MADIRQFAAKTSLTGGTKVKRNSLMQKIHADNITIKYMSRDGLVALIQKQRQKIKPRQNINNAMLQNIKKAQIITKTLEEKLSSLPELRAATSKTSTTPLPRSKTLLRALSPEAGTSQLYGFQYRSNGDIRVSHRKSIDENISKYQEASRNDFNSLKQSLMKATMIHSRDSKGEYTFSPVLNKLLKREPRPSKSVSELAENLEVFRYTSKDRHISSIHSKSVSDTVFQNATLLRDRPLIGRRYLIKENNKFIKTMMQQIYLLEPEQNQQTGFSDRYEGGEGLQDFDNLLRRGPATAESEPVFKSARHVPLRNTVSDIPMVRAKSSFNMRYGVPSKVLESRKTLLDEYMLAEMRRVSKTDAEIDEFIQDIKNDLAEKEKKRNRKESESKPSFDFWQTEDSQQTDTGTRADEGTATSSKSEDVSGST